eukprot:Rmarinus@m.7422
MDTSEIQKMMGGGGGADMQAQEEKRKQIEEQRNSILSSILEPEAKARLQRIGITRPERAQALENAIIQKAQMGQIRSKISEDQLIAMLEGTADSRKTKITFVRKSALDDDW